MKQHNTQSKQSSAHYIVSLLRSCQSFLSSHPSSIFSLVSTSLHLCFTSVPLSALSSHPSFSPFTPWDSPCSCSQALLPVGGLEVYRLSKEQSVWVPVCVHQSDADTGRRQPVKVDKTCNTHRGHAGGISWRATTVQLLQLVAMAIPKKWSGRKKKKIYSFGCKNVCVLASLNLVVWETFLQNHFCRSPHRWAVWFIVRSRVWFCDG